MASLVEPVVEVVAHLSMGSKQSKAEAEGEPVLEKRRAFARFLI
jgi:hypothetical protein